MGLVLTEADIRLAGLCAVGGAMSLLQHRKSGQLSGTLRALPARRLEDVQTGPGAPPPQQGDDLLLPPLLHALEVPLALHLEGQGADFL